MSNSKIKEYQKVKSEWLVRGLTFGVLMMIFQIGTAIYEDGWQELSPDRLGREVLAWSLAGLSFGFFMRLFAQWQIKRLQKKADKT